MSNETIQIIFKGTQLLLTYGPGVVEQAIKIKEFWQADPANYVITVKELRASSSGDFSEALRAIKEWESKNPA